MNELSVYFSVRVHTAGLWKQNRLFFGIKFLKLAPGYGRKLKIADTDTIILDRIENQKKSSRQLNDILGAIESEFSITMFETNHPKKISLETLP